MSNKYFSQIPKNTPVNSTSEDKFENYLQDLRDTYDSCCAMLSQKFIDALNNKEKSFEVPDRTIENEGLFRMASESFKKDLIIKGYSIGEKYQSQTWDSDGYPNGDGKYIFYI